VRDLAFGRALAQRARAAYLAGEQDVAADLYTQVDALGKRLHSVELRARAANGFTGLAQVRGNHPEMLAQATRGLALAEQTGIPRLRWNARYSIMMSTAVFRRYDEALAHGWELFSLIRGDATGEGIALQSLGQLLLEMGDVRAATSAFSAAVTRRLPAHVLLASLGSLAVTAALSGTRRTVEWAVAEVERFREAASPWAYAASLLDCVIALRDSGETERAARLRNEAIALCARHQFHALTYRAENIQADIVSPVPEHKVVSGATSEILDSVHRLAPRRLPRHVRMAAVGS
jgi:hypothetical protein